MENEVNNIKQMLNKVHVLNKSDAEIKKATGARYNMFQVLRVQRKELKHSLIIGDLLNPKGRHDQGDTYLKLFIEVIQESIKLLVDGEKDSKELNSTLSLLKDFKTREAKVHIEYPIGVKNGVEGGRIDILLESKGKCIIIENKVDAQDQKFQLLRYKNHRGKNSLVLYLNKFGGQPDEMSYTTKEYIESKAKPKVKVREDGRWIHLDKDEDFFIITFKNEIKEWIEKCIETSNDKPYIRGNLNQYLEIIKRISNQLNSNYMSKELTAYFKENRNQIDEAKSLSNYINTGEIYEELVGKKIVSIAKEIAENCKVVLDEVTLNNWEKYDSKGANKIINFRFEELHHFTLSYKCNTRVGYGKFIFVLRKKNGIEVDLTAVELNNNLAKEIRSAFPNRQSDELKLKPHKYSTILTSTLSKFSNLESSKSIALIENGDFKTFLKDDLMKMLVIAKRIENLKE